MVLNDAAAVLNFLSKNDIEIWNVSTLPNCLVVTNSVAIIACILAKVAFHNMIIHLVYKRLARLAFRSY